MIVIAFVAPFYLTSVQLASLDSGWQGVGAVSSLLTFLIAVLLFNKFGIEKSIIDRQTEAVISLIEKLKQETFFMDVVIKTCTTINFSPIRGQKELYGDLMPYQDLPLLFGKSYFEKLKEIQVLVDGLFMPVEIVEQFEQLRFKYGTQASTNFNVEYIIVRGKSMDEISDINNLTRERFREENKKLYKKDINLFYEEMGRALHIENPLLLNGEAIVLKKFIERWDELLSVAGHWLSKHSNLPFSLNMDISK